MSSPQFRMVFFFALLLAALPAARAATIVWANTGTDFNAGASWVGGVAPGSSSTASFNGAANASFQPTLSANASVGTLYFSAADSSGYILSGASPSYTLTTGSLAINTLHTSGTNTINVPLVLPTSATMLVESGGTVVINTAINGVSGTLTKDGGGTLALTALNSYTGQTWIEVGTLTVSSIGNIGGGSSNLGAPTTVANGTIDFGHSGVAQYFNGTLRYIGPTVSTDRPIFIEFQATIDSSGSGPMTWTAGMAGGNGGGVGPSLTLTGSTDGNTFGVITDGAGGHHFALVKDGTGSWGLSAANSYTGGTTITDGVLFLLGLGDLGSPTATVTVNNTARLNLNGRSVSIGAFGGTGTIVNDATGTAVTLSIGNSSNTGENGTIADHTTGTGTIAVAKVGTGTFTMYGNNSYTGGTTVEAGTLAVGNNPALGTGGVQVGASGALTLLSSISINNSIDLYGRLNGPGPGTPGATAGAVVLNSGGVVAPNFSVLTLGSLTWNGGGKVSIQLGGGSGASDRVAITGQLARGTGSGFVFDFNNTGGGALDPSVYTLLSFGSLNGFTAGDASPFSYINLGAGRTGSFTLTSTSLLFTSTAIPEPSTYAAIAGGLALAGVLIQRRRRR